jgi:hypothetical protein
VAIYGGDGRQVERWGTENTVYFQSSRSGGNGPLRRLEAALRAGRIELVVIVRKWNGHPGADKVRRLCRRLGIPCQVS